MIDAKVYIVDDNMDLCQSLKYLFDSVKIPTQIYHAPRDFLANYTDAPGCLLLDMRMPEMTGLALQDLLRHDKIHIPLIFMTGHGDVSMAVRAMKKGAFDFFTKPFDHQLLLEAVHRAMDADHQYRREREKYRCFERLTQQERDIVQRVVAGESTLMIAKALHLSSKTIEYHRGKIMKKLGVATPLQLVSFYHSYRSIKKD